MCDFGFQVSLPPLYNQIMSLLDAYRLSAYNEATAKLKGGMRPTCFSVTCSKGCNRSLALVQALAYLCQVPLWAPSIWGLDQGVGTFTLCEHFTADRLTWLKRLSLICWMGPGVPLSDGPGAAQSSDAPPGLTKVKEEESYQYDYHTQKALLF